MTISKNTKLVTEYKRWLSGDNFALTIHIAPSKRKHEEVIELLEKFVCSRLNKYLVGSSWRKKDFAKQIHFFGSEKVLTFTTIKSAVFFMEVHL